MTLKFPKELILGGEEWKTQPFRFNVHAINTGSYTPSYRDVTVTGVSPLNLPNAQANGLKSIKLFGKCEQIPNLFDKDRATLNYYINASGEEQYNVSWACSDYIEVTVGKPYNLSGVSSYGSSPRTGFYAADKSFVSSRSQSSADFTIPDGVKYMRVSIYKANIDTAVIKQILSMDTPIPILCNNGEVGSTGYTVVGSPTITSDLVLSNTTGSNYVYFANVNLGSNFEIITKFTTGDNVTSENFILGTVGRYFVVKYQNAKISFGIGDGSSWKTGNTDSTTSLAIDTTYYYKLTFDGSTYNAYLSTDGETWNLEKTVSLTTIVPMFSMRVGCHGNSGSNAAIDLKELQIIINNVPIYKRELVELNGSTAFAQDLLSCGENYADEQNITTGEITRKVGYLILNGTENWGIQYNYTDIFYFRTGKNAVSPNTCICTHFLGKASSAGIGTLTDGDIKYGYNTQLDRVYIKYSAYDNDLAGFKSWLAAQNTAGTPVIVVFPLEAPATESVTAQDSLQTIAGDNTITITQAAVQYLQVEVTYSAGVEVTIEEVEAANVDQQVEVTIGG